MIKGIIFDIGGVLVDVRIKSFLKNFVKESGFSKEDLYKMILLSKDWEEFEKGLINEEEFKERVEKSHGIEPKLMDKMADGWRSTLKPINDTIDIVKKLKGRYKLFALSNVDEVTTKDCFEKFDFYKHFDEMVLSWKVHMRKPEKEIYEHVLKRMGLKPEEAVFIDNYPVNLPVPKKMGIHTILYESPGQLRNDLKKLGIEV